VKWRREAWRLLLLAALVMAGGYGGIRAGVTLVDGTADIGAAAIAGFLGGALGAAAACVACGTVYSRLDAREQRKVQLHR
jgi:hypothetical protein